MYYFRQFYILLLYYVGVRAFRFRQTCNIIAKLPKKNNFLELLRSLRHILHEDQSKKNQSLKLTLMMQSDRYSKFQYSMKNKISLSFSKNHLIKFNVRNQTFGNSALFWDQIFIYSWRTKGFNRSSYQSYEFPPSFKLSPIVQDTNMQSI